MPVGLCGGYKSYFHPPILKIVFSMTSCGFYYSDIMALFTIVTG